MKEVVSKQILVCCLVAIALAFTPSAFSDGNADLGDPSIPIASGTTLLAAGVGLNGATPGEGTINLNVPAGASVEQVLLYWVGRGGLDPVGNTATVGGIAVVGDLIGAEGTFREARAYRVDITSLGLVNAGPNSVTVEDVAFPYRADGAMLLVIIDDGSAALDTLQILDGMDFAYINDPGTLNVTVPQTFTFDPAGTDRNAKALIALGDGTPDRQDKTDVYVGGDRTFFCNLAQGADGPEWDTNFIPLLIPAGETSVTLQLFSEQTECPNLGTTPDSLSWMVAALAIEPPDDEPPGACWMTGGGVKFESVTNVWSAECKSANGGGPKDSVGGVVFPSCSQYPGNGGNWNHVSHSLKLHLLGQDIHSVSCGNVPGIPPGSESPVCDVNYIEFYGTGEIRGIKGNKIEPFPVSFFGRVEDRNEPGNEQSATSGEDIDRYYLRVWDAGGNLVFLIDADGIDDGVVDPLTISGGNFQIHCTSCD